MRIGANRFISSTLCNFVLCSLSEITRIEIDAKPTDGHQSAEPRERFRSEKGTDSGRPKSDARCENSGIVYFRIQLNYNVSVF